MSVQTIGRYQITGELGKGAMGVVYTALDPTIGRTVALKSMRLDVHGLENDEVLRRFRNEARAAGVLNHPNIVTIYDAGEQDGIFYIAMEMIEGTTLHQVLADQRTLPADRVIELARQICAGLDYAHAHGVIHRDVKPANIMITPAGMVKIMDFGIAKAGGAMTTAGQVLGTPNYMSPEQVKGRTLDGRSDLFSLGVILYEMVTGEKPFTGQNVTTIIYKIVHENPISPRDLDVTIHPGLSAVITRALAKSPDERYQTGAQLVRELENYKALHGSTEVTSVMAIEPGLKAAALAVPQVDSGAAAAPAPAAAVAKVESTVSAPQVRLASARPAVRREGRYLLPALLAVVALIFAIGGFALWRHNRQLEQERARIAAEQAQSTAVSSDISQSPPAEPGQPSAAEAQKPGAAAAKPAVPAPITPKPSPLKSSETATTAPAKPARAAEKPGTSTAPALGEIYITSTPAGAAVMVDGWSDPRWVTPFVATRLTPGEHVLTFTRNGFITHTRRVVVESGKRASVSATLASSAATLNVASEPSGAEILVDGKPTGKLTPAAIQVEQGEHRLVVRRKGYKEAAVTAKVGEGESFNFAPTLSPDKPESGGGNIFGRIFGSSIPKGQGMVDVRTSPRKAEIVVDGRKAPKTTPYKFALPPGSHTLSIRLDGYQPIEKKITVEEGKVLTLNETLKKK